MVGCSAICRMPPSAGGGQALRRVRLGHQRVERVLRERDLFAQGLDLLACLRQAAFALAQFEARVEAGRDAVAHQLQRFFALRERALRDGQLVGQPRPLEVAARDVAGQQDAGCVGIGGRGIRAADGGFDRGAVLAEEVDLPACVELQRAGLLDRAAERRRVDVVAAELLPRQVELAIDLRLAGRFGDSGRGLRARETRLRHLQVGIALQRLVDQCVELGVAEAEPPLAVDGGRGLCVRQAQRIGIAELGMRIDVRHVGAAGQDGDRQRGGQGNRAAARELRRKRIHLFLHGPQWPVRCRGCGADSP